MALCLGHAPVAAVPRSGSAGASKRSAPVSAQAPSARALSSRRASFAGRVAQHQAASGRATRRASHLLAATASSAPIVLAASAPAKAAPRGADLKALAYSVLAGVIIWLLPAPVGVTPKAWHLLAHFVATIVGIITSVRARAPRGRRGVSRGGVSAPNGLPSDAAPGARGERAGRTAPLPSWRVRPSLHREAEGRLWRLIGHAPTPFTLCPTHTPLHPPAAAPGRHRDGGPGRRHADQDADVRPGVRGVRQRDPLVRFWLDMRNHVQPANHHPLRTG
jgi:hypothetical protein